MARIISSLTLTAVCGALLASTAGAVAQAGGGDLLQNLEKGLWQLRPVAGGSSAGPNQLCVNDTKQLAQLQHRNSACSQLVVRSSPTSVTISYSCRGAGQGLTTIRKETDRLIQIQSQGISNNAPFSFSVEARRQGGC